MVSSPLIAPTCLSPSPSISSTCSRVGSAACLRSMAARLAIVIPSAFSSPRPPFVAFPLPAPAAARVIGDAPKGIVGGAGRNPAPTARRYHHHTIKMQAVEVIQDGFDIYFL